jgi:phage terminase large subunit-like protein
MELARREQATKFLTMHEDKVLYKKHREFMAAGKNYKQRVFMAGNRIGKSVTAQCELVMHLTGIYPDWWEGKRFTTVNHWWIVCVDSDTIKGTFQPALLGPIGDLGNGLIPRDLIDYSTLKDAQKSDTLIDSFRVRHVSGAYSSVEFKSTKSGRAAFQGTERNILIDEECPQDVYVECLTRTMTSDCIVIMTFTPLKGLTPLIKDYYGEHGFTTESTEVGYNKYSVNATWDECGHLSESEKISLMNSIPPFQRDARSKGIPSLGAGVIYPVPETTYVIEPFEIPAHWKKMYGLDVGWKKTAAVWLAIDPDTGITYLYSEHYLGEEHPSIHASSIRARGDWIPGTIDSAANGRSQTDGENLMQMYRDLGLEIHNADKAVETGLFTCWQLLSEGRIKVFSNLTNFLAEIRLYHRDEKGKIHKSFDHLMDAWRYAMMGRDLAKVKKPPGSNRSSIPRTFSG